MIRPPWLEVAEREASWGVAEIAGDRHESRIVAYHGATTLRATEDEVPWCASFVGFCLRESGVPHTRSAAARSYLEWGEDLGAWWAHGAVVVLNRAGGPGPDAIRTPDGYGYYPGHVGFLVGAPTPDELLVLAGNQSDAINVRAFPRSRVLGVRWPRST